ncbi:MAG TPA: histidine phosphatase family protein [Geminicoccus sp.]|jgi:phosphohistidine phosphatase|uniref:SixA phosphatase family protein n=1 Tax=Geminicoccus sp. TaxID=2024832 RepID=UPI002E304044|nr:histidine phosphatase family protein [Geminicoccus sp.]HEX2528440.1 histidine phosphatase family protein [Geminicoccus sp.]
MTTIYLLRHAKSRWDEPGVDDHDRGLAPRGERDAPAMGRHAAGQGWRPDLVLCSTAKRAVLTASAFLEAAGFKPELRHSRSLYLAAAPDLLNLVRQQEADGIMLVGHDPGIHELALLLTGPHASQRLQEKFPTAALAVIAFEGRSPAEIAAGEGMLSAFVRPKDLRQARPD